ncbi:uncharacterized protein [Rutidosis leptorrhynchoides]|uniref:uncharacterized protein n=1 Tax=Rutidosis leptorrhynchoides TaxID=125765 RepID=UPI003A99FA0C
MLLNVSLDEKVLPTTNGQLKPPLEKHRLKIVEFLSVLLKTGNEIAENELISSGTIQRVIDLFFENLIAFVFLKWLLEQQLQLQS